MIDCWKRMIKDKDRLLKNNWLLKKELMGEQEWLKNDWLLITSDCWKWLIAEKSNSLLKMHFWNKTYCYKRMIGDKDWFSEKVLIAEERIYWGKRMTEKLLICWKRTIADIAEKDWFLRSDWLLEKKQFIADEELIAENWFLKNDWLLKTNDWW